LVKLENENEAQGLVGKRTSSRTAALEVRSRDSAIRDLERGAVDWRRDWPGTRVAGSADGCGNDGARLQRVRLRADRDESRRNDCADDRRDWAENPAVARSVLRK